MLSNLVSVAGIINWNFNNFEFLGLIFYFCLLWFIPLSIILFVIERIIKRKDIERKGKKTSKKYKWFYLSCKIVYCITLFMILYVLLFL